MSARVSAATQSLVPVGIDPAHVGDVLAPLSVACASPVLPSRAYVMVGLVPLEVVAIVVVDCQLLHLQKIIVIQIWRRRWNLPRQNGGSR